MQIYRIADLQKKVFIIEKAKQMWKERCAEYILNNGDRGTCVLGAGIYVNLLRPRCRIPIRYTIISAGSVCSAQGSIVWEDSKDEIMNFLRENGIDCSYIYGNAD